VIPVDLRDAATAHADDYLIMMAELANL
jgi:aspartyl-tRNA(Asn)/glutamyl-tRNA(Gln) amidotransferase subunit A